jgi:Ni/Co efflux regulator RcnB
MRGNEVQRPQDQGPRGNRPPPPRWNKGDQLPMDYRSKQYVIDDWKSFKLSAPPHRHRWVGVGADFYLVNASNGRIQDMMGGR